MILKSPIFDKQLSLYLKTKDYFLSQELFELWRDEENDFLITHPCPTQSDISKYYQTQKYLSHHSNDYASFMSSLYNLVKKYMLRQKWNFIQKHHAGKIFLDIGCGAGDFIHYGMNIGLQGDGVEFSDDARQFAQQKKHRYLTKNLFDDYLKSESYDIITLWHVLEHLHDLNKSILRIKSLLKPEGIIILALPNFKSADAQHYQSFWSGYDTPRHLYHFSKKSIENISHHYGLTLIHVGALPFDTYYNCILSEKYKTQKMKWITALCKAFYFNLTAFITSKEKYSSLFYVLRK